jgi:hypothetical protein
MKWFRGTMIGLFLSGQGLCVVVVGPDTFHLQYEQGTTLASPYTTNVALDSIVGSFSVSIAANPTGWLSVNPTQGSGPTAVLSVSVMPQALSVGSYIGLITITDQSPRPPIVGNPTATVQINLTVTAGSTPTTPPIVSSAPASVGYIAHIADGGSWSTVITVLNLAATAQRISLFFWSDSGQAFPLQVVGISNTVSSVYFDLPPNGVGILQTLGALPNVATGWLSLSSTVGAFGASAVFQQVSSSGISEAASPMASSQSMDAIITFDNRNGFDSGIAIANSATVTNALTLTLRDYTGTVIASDALTLGSGSHTSLDLLTRYPGTQGTFGTLEIQAPTVGFVSLGLRFDPSGAFTSLLPISR